MSVEYVYEATTKVEHILIKGRTTHYHPPKYHPRVAKKIYMAFSSHHSKIKICNNLLLYDYNVVDVISVY